jgi:multiple sugar transport system permease protein
MLLMMFFLVLPVVVALFLALTDLSLIGQQRDYVSFVGFDNFYRLFRDQVFYRSLSNTFLVILFSGVIGQQLLGLITARLMQHRHPFFRRIIRTSMLAGWLIPDVVVAFIFYLLFAVEGSVNMVLLQAGAAGIPWLYEHPLAIIIVADIWSNAAYSVVMYEQSFDNISPELYDSARLDGASGFILFSYVTVPLLLPDIRANTMFITLRSIGVFTLVFLLTGGGPAQSTSTLSLYLFQNTISLSTIGFGASAGCVLLILVSALGLIYRRVDSHEGILMP